MKTSNTFFFKQLRIADRNSRHNIQEPVLIDIEIFPVVTFECLELSVSLRTEHFLLVGSVDQPVHLVRESSEEVASSVDEGHVVGDCVDSLHLELRLCGLWADPHCPLLQTQQGAASFILEEVSGRGNLQAVCRYNK